MVRTQLETSGKGKVLVVDGKGSLPCALVGDQLVELAIRNNCEGIIVNGCIRDSYQINNMSFGIKALNKSPVKSIKQNVGDQNIPVKFAGITFNPGQFIYTDEDGLLLSEKKLL